MEKDKNPFPEFDLFPKLDRAARFIKRLLTPLPIEAPDFMSEHYRGYDPYDGVQVEGFLYDGRNEQQEFPFS